MYTKKYQNNSKFNQNGLYCFTFSSTKKKSNGY